ncbi:MAG: hypothetical protein IPP54_12675 [Anaerolineales bacterium]|nr:hypothetical protein [Anaerolineales bacterium]
MDEENRKANEHNGIGLMNQRDDDVDVGQDGEYAQCDLERNHADQPLESVLDIGGVILFFYDVIYQRHKNQSQPGEPAMNEDDGLWGFKDVDPRVEQVGWN